MKKLCLMAALLLAACSSQPPAVETYLLRSQATTSSQERSTESDIALGEVKVAMYLQQPGLVLASGDGKIHQARYHRWAEPLQVSLRQYLADEISAAMEQQISANGSGSTKSLVDVQLNQLHGDGNGAAVLVAYWELRSADATTSFQFSERQPIDSDGYDSLVQAELALLRQLAEAIATEISARGAGSD